MKAKTLIPDPLVFYRLNLRIVDAVILTHLGRCGLQGCSRVSAAESSKMPYGTAANSFLRLEEAGFLTRYSKSNGQGRTARFVITSKGWEIMTTPSDLDMFPDALSAVS